MHAHGGFLLYPPKMGGKIERMNSYLDRPADGDIPIILSRMAIGTWVHYAFDGNTFLEVQRTGWGFQLVAARDDAVAIWYAGVRRSGMEYRISDHGGAGGFVSELHVPGLITALGVALEQLHLGVAATVRAAQNEPANV